MLKRFFLSSLSFTVAAMTASTLFAQATRDDGEETPAVKTRTEEHGTPSKPLLKILDEVEKAVAKEIDLEKDQKGPVEEVFDEVRSRIEEQNAAASQDGKDNAKRLAEIREAMNKAREAKDWEEFRNLTKQMREITQNQPNTTEVLRELHETLKEILDDDQQDKLDDIFKRYKGEFENKFQEGMLKLMVLMRAMDEIDVDDDQVKDIKDLKLQFAQDMKNLDKSDTAAMDRMYKDSREALVNILHDDQVQALEKAEAEAMANMRDHRGPRPGMPDARKDSTKAKTPTPVKEGADKKAKSDPKGEPENEADEDDDEEDEDDQRS